MSFIFLLKQKFLLHRYLFGIFIAALAIRWWGSDYGFPIIFSIDEPSFVRSVIGLRFDLSPNRFDWPHANFYLHFIFYVGLYAVRVFFQITNLKPFIESIFPILWHDPIVFYFLSRLLNGFLGALTVIPIYLSSRQLLKSHKLALATSFLFAFIPFHISDSHKALLDTSMTFWISWSIYYSLKIIEDSKTKNYVLSGLFLGLAFGTKYNAVLYYLFIALCIVYSVILQNKILSPSLKNVFLFIKTLFQINNIKKYFIHLVFFLLAFLFTNLSIIKDFDVFWSDDYGRGFLFQFENVGNKTWEEYPASIYENFVTQSIEDYGLSLYIAIAVMYITYILFNNRNKITNLSLLFPLLLYFYISSKDRNPSHYYLFLYPLISIGVVYFLYQLSTNISSYFSFIPKLKAKNLFLTFFTLVMISPLIDSVYLSYRLSRPDTRELAYAWLQNNVSKDDQIYFYRGELESLPYIDLKAKKIVRVDEDYVDTSKLPFYLFIGVEGLTYSDIMEGDRDTKKIEGNESRFVNNAELMFYKEPKNQFGPPVYIFKVYSLESN